MLTFIDWLWQSFLKPHTPKRFLEELEGMEAWHADAGSAAPPVSPASVASR